ncbi:hypothetical protein BDR07DRAFT_1380619 [Suillus spraguei]|nr:hypothetical protein BDR07DRAFT_1380619 [Suillus spraguei]
MPDVELHDVKLELCSPVDVELSMKLSINLKFKGNMSFVAFSNLGDTESLMKTWKGQHLKNLSWQLWHLENLMVDTNNAKSIQEVVKEYEQQTRQGEGPAPDFKQNASRGDGTPGANHASSNPTSDQNGVFSSATNDSSYENELLGEEYDGEDDGMADAPIAQPDDMKEDKNNKGDSVMRYDKYSNSNNSDNNVHVPTQPEGESLLCGPAASLAKNREPMSILSSMRDQKSIGIVTTLVKSPYSYSTCNLC